MRLLRPLRVFSLACCLVTALGQGVRGQQERQPAPYANLRIVALGGFLGYLDGLMVKPDKGYGPLDGPKGGMLGVQEWLTPTHFVRERDLLVLTGNNLPLDSAAIAVLARPDAHLMGTAPLSWLHAMNDLHADAIAFSIEDFLRSLRDGKMAGVLTQWVNSPRAPPFVASNVIVRLHKKALNMNSSRGMTLDIPTNESVGWLSELRLSCRKCAPVHAALHDITAGDTTVFESDLGGMTDHRLTLKLPRPLRPGRLYSLEVRRAGSVHAASFNFRTHPPFVRLGSGADSVPADLQGLPIRYARRQVAGADSGIVTAPLVIVGFIDQSTKMSLGADLWRWKRGQPGS
ncbi:MAG TPA: hypothetical protein VNZ26_30035, partial [Vicinamibacterales bacterium]|nr:hypothetical protein [Vicinamibacterales bacterium]